MAENKMKQDVSKAIRASDSDKSFARLFHGSAHGSLTVLEPSLSEHGEAFVYFTVNPVIALIYTVKPVPKPFSFYPYGFDENGRVVYSEYWKNAFYDLYKGKTGFLYECAEVSGLFNPTAINGVFVSRESAPVTECTEIFDVYDKLKEYESKGLFAVKPFDSVSKQELDFVKDDLRRTAERYDLKNKPDNPMSVFLRKYFKNII